MRKTISIIIPLYVTVFFVGVLVVAHISRGPGWQGALNSYLAYKKQISSGAYTLQYITRARKPWNFSEDMSDFAFGESSYHQIGTWNSNQSYDNNPRSIHTEVQTSSIISSLIFPPKEAWCAWLSLTNTTFNPHDRKAISIVIFVALHEDLYNAEYIIHEANTQSSDQLLIDRVSKIGCKPPQ